MMCEKVVDINKFYISWFYLECHSSNYQCGGVVLIAVMYIFFTGHAIPFKYIQTVFFNKLDRSFLLVFVLDYHHCLYQKRANIPFSTESALST